MNFKVSTVTMHAILGCSYRLDAVHARFVGHSF